MYTRYRMDFLNAREVYEFYKAEYGAPGKKREKKKKLTPEQMEIINQANRERMCRWRIRGHFDINDYFIRLSYKKELRPSDMNQAKKDFANFRDKLKRRYRKRGYELKAIWNIEVGSRGAWHVHVIINRIPEADILIRECWKHGSIWFQLLYEKGEFKELASYITKTPKTDPRLKETHYSHTRNIPLPEPKKKDYERWKPWAKVRIPEGWELEEEPKEGNNPITGHKYRKYTLIRKVRKERPPALLPKRRRKPKDWKEPEWWDGPDMEFGKEEEDDS